MLIRSQGRALPYPEAPAGRALQIHSRAAGKVFLRTASGIFRGSVALGDWEKLPTEIKGIEDTWLIGEPANLWVAARGQLKQVHWDTQLVFRPTPSWRILGWLANDWLTIGGKKVVLATRNRTLEPSHCKYEGPTIPTVTVLESCVDAEEIVLTESSLLRGQKVGKWEAGSNTTEDQRTESVKASGLWMSLYGGILDRHKNIGTLDFLVVSPTFIEWLACILMSTMLLPPFRHFSIWLLELIFGQRILGVALRLRVLGSPYSRRYSRTALSQLIGTMKGETRSTNEEIVGEVTRLLGDYRLVAIKDPAALISSASLERGLLKRRSYQGLLKRLRTKLHKKSIDRLIPLRVDFAFNADSLEEMDSYVVKRLKSLGGLEKRIAEYLWEHTDFLILLDMSGSWSISDSRWNLMSKFVALHGEDLDNRFVLLGLKDEPDQGWQAALDASNIRGSCVVRAEDLIYTSSDSKGADKVQQPFPTSSVDTHDSRE